jgi:alpha-L-fucosidase
MDTPARWNEQRFGLVVQNSVAAVPAWAPIGYDARRYRQYLGEDGSNGLVEVLAHHRDRWGYVGRFDDFVDLLTFERFDADDWAGLAVEAGMTHVEVQARDPDGWCWWDAPDADRTTVDRGPRRDVLREFASACDGRDLRFTARCAAPTGEISMAAVERQRADLAATFGTDRVRVDPSEDRAEDRGEHPAPDGRWELRRGVGPSLGYNRAERPEHQLSGFDVVDLLCEVVARGGQLLLSVGPTSGGDVPDHAAHALREAGTWIREHHDLLHRAVPWTTWGDEDVRYLVLDGALHAIDLHGRGVFAAIDRTSQRVVSVTSVHPAPADLPVPFRHDEDGLQVEPDRRPVTHATGVPSIRAIRTYRIELVDVDAPETLFEPTPPPRLPLQPLLDDAVAGDIVQLGDACYVGPVTVPPGVVLRGLGTGRTTIEVPGGSPVRLDRNARLEHVRVLLDGTPDELGGTRPPVAVEIVGAFATVLGCAIDGEVAARADGVVVRATAARRISAADCHHLTVSRCELVGSELAGTAIDLIGGDDHEIDSCTVSGHRCAVRARGTIATIVRGCTITSRWWGVRLEGTERAHVHGNRVSRTTRAVDVDGGAQALVDGNAVFDGDSGCVLQRGAAGCQVSGNYWERCRVGLLAWGATGVHQQDNIAADLHEPDHATITGP